MSYSRIRGFFYSKGSMDYPSTMGINDKFGYNQLDPTLPLFDYSINEVERSFNDGIELSRVGILEPTQLSTLLVETNGSEELKEIDADSADWSKIFKIIEYLYHNQLTANTPTGTMGYASQADELLSSPTNQDGTSNQYYVETYVRGSITMITTSIKDNMRMRDVSFLVTVTDNGVSRNVTIEVSMEPNYFVFNSVNDDIRVWKYHDMSTPADRNVDNNELTAAVIELNEIGKGNYEHVSVLLVNRYNPDDTVTEEIYHIFHNITNIAKAKLEIAVVSWLRNNVSNDTGYLATLYPDLFETSSISIYPMFHNVVSISSVDKIVHGATLENVLSLMNTLNLPFNPTDITYKKTTIFHVGYEGDSAAGVSNLLPLLAVDNLTESDTDPIVERYPDYVPKYGTYLANTGTTWETFQHYIILALDIINGISGVETSPEVIELQNGIASFTITPALEEGTVKQVSFKINGILYNVIDPYRTSTGTI